MKEGLFSLIYKWFKSEIDELCEQAEEGGRVMCAQEIGRKMFLRGMDFETVEDLTGLMEGEVEYLQLDVQNGCLGSNHAKSREKSLKSREKTLFLQQKVGRKWLQ